MIACTVDRNVKLYSVKYRKFMHQMSGGHSETINASAFCHSYPTALTGSGDRTIKVWDASTGQQKGKMGCATGIFALEVAISDSVVASGHRDGSVKFWSIKEGTIVHEIKDVHDSIVSSVSYMPNDSNQIITSGRDHTVRLVDIRMLKVLQTYESEYYYSSSDNSQIAISPAGRYLALGSKNGKLVIFDTQKDDGQGGVETIFDKQHKGQAITGVDWSRKTSRIASIDSKGNLYVWN